MIARRLSIAAARTVPAVFLAIAGGGGCTFANVCPEGWVRDWCGGSAHCCRPPEGPTCCNGPHHSSLSSVPRPDLSGTNLDGLVDFGRSSLKVTGGGDSLDVKLKGRVAIEGGVCPQPECPLRLVLVELEPLPATVSTANGKAVSGLIARNANVWTGRRRADGTIVMDSGSRLAIEGTVAGRSTAAVLGVESWFEGSIVYNTTRLTDDGPVRNNRIDVTGTFADEQYRVSLALHVWATNCQPALAPTARCVPDIEPGQPGKIRFDSNPALFGSMQSSQDLCEAMKADYAAVCRAGGSSEFPTFTCKKGLLPTGDPAAIAGVLKATWRDAQGQVLGSQLSYSGTRVPVFPVTVTVRNEVLGKEVSATLSEPPVCSPSVPLAPGACAWEGPFGPESHQSGRAWCPEGGFLTAFDLDGGLGVSGHDAPLVGHARCCAPRAEPTTWTSCSWLQIGRRSHQTGPRWCSNDGFLTALDLDADAGLSAHDSPVVGAARCCTPAAAGAGLCTWVEVGTRSHQREGSWCAPDSYLAGLDLDALAGASEHDSPVVGRALCCSTGTRVSEGRVLETVRRGQEVDLVLHPEREGRSYDVLRESLIAQGIDLEPGADRQVAFEVTRPSFALLKVLSSKGSLENLSVELWQEGAQRPLWSSARPSEPEPIPGLLKRRLAIDGTLIEAGRRWRLSLANRSGRKVSVEFWIAVVPQKGD